MQLAARWTLVPLLAVTGAAALLVVAPHLDAEDDDEPDEVTEHHVGIAGSLALGDACMPFLDAVTARPAWSLQLVDTASSCLGARYIDRFELHADGLVVWSPVGLAERRLQLTPAQLARIRTADRLGCEVAKNDDYGDRYFDVGLGIFDGSKTVGGGEHVSQDSPAGAAIREVLDAAIEAYAEQRLQALGRFELRLAVAPWAETWTRETARYRVELADDGMLRVSRGDALLHVETVTRRELIDVVDWAYATSSERTGRDRELLAAAGVLDLGGRTFPVALWKWDNHELSPHGILFRAANGAEFYELKR